MALSLDSNPSALNDQKCWFWDENLSLCKYCDDAEGKLSFLPHVYLQNIWNPLEYLGHELFTFNSRKRRLPVNFTGKGKRRDSKVKGFPKSVLEFGTGFPGGSDESACNAGDLGSIPRLGRSPGGGHANPLQYSCLGKSKRQRSLACCSRWGHKESDMTEKLSHTHTHKADWWKIILQDQDISAEFQIQFSAAFYPFSWRWVNSWDTCMFLWYYSKCKPKYVRKMSLFPFRS